MSDQTHSSSQMITVQLPTGQQLYDALMSDIEADLVTANIPTLDEKYAGETPEQNAARLERYRKAYEKYDEAFASWMLQFEHLVNQYRKEALQLHEKESQAIDASTMAALEQQFTSQK